MILKKIIFVGLILILAVPALANKAVRVTSKDLVDHAKELDGQKVILAGEVIGDVMPRNQNAWINVQDELGTVSVWIPQDMVSAIKFKGDYSHRGDSVEVVGEFRRADPELGGELCIRAEYLRILSQGNYIVHLLNPAKTRLSLIFLTLAALFMILRLILKRKRKES